MPPASVCVKCTCYHPTNGFSLPYVFIGIFWAYFLLSLRDRYNNRKEHHKERGVDYKLITSPHVIPLLSYKPLLSYSPSFSG
jgi:hypothetical protein